MKAVAAPAPGSQVPAAAPGPLAELLAYIGQQASAAGPVAITQENGSATVDREKSEKLHKDAANLGDEIDELELRWLELHESLDALPSPD